jgi:hypothetical protein
MSIRRKGLILSGILSACLNNAIAQQTVEPELTDLYQKAVHGCPAKWEDLVAYVNHAPNDVTSRIRYDETDHENRIDIWSGNIRDRQNYIKFALDYFRTDEGVLIENYTQIASVLYGCGITRNNYLVKLMDERRSETIAFNSGGRFDEFRDHDDDGVMNEFDSCLSTSEPPMDTGMLIQAEDLEIFNANGLLVVNGQGCAAWEFDTDGDTVADYFDHCPDEFGSVTTVDGCVDADEDGVSDKYDAYPYQHDTLCVAE